MKKINRILKQLGDLYEFNQRIKGYTLKKREATNRVVKGFSHPSTTPSHKNVNGASKVGHS